MEGESGKGGAGSEHPPGIQCELSTERSLQPVWGWGPRAAPPAPTGPRARAERWGCARGCLSFPACPGTDLPGRPHRLRPPRPGVLPRGCHRPGGSSRAGSGAPWWAGGQRSHPPACHSHPAFLGCSWADGTRGPVRFPPAGGASCPPRHGPCRGAGQPGRRCRGWLRGLGAAGSNKPLPDKGWFVCSQRGPPHVMPADRCLVAAQLCCAQPGAQLVTSGPACPLNLGLGVPELPGQLEGPDCQGTGCQCRWMAAALVFIEKAAGAAWAQWW